MFRKIRFKLNDTVFITKKQKKQTIQDTYVLLIPVHTISSENIGVLSRELLILILLFSSKSEHLTIFYVAGYFVK